MASSIILEVCLTSADDASIAHRAGADRIELNAALQLGGLTPSLGMLRAVKAAAPLPIIAMIRPRPGGFRYSDADFEVMRIDTETALQYGADGIAFGILNENGEIDEARCRILRDAIGHHQAVFHRAFDVTPDPFLAMEQLIDLGCTRILTSGQRESAIEGADLIRRLIERSRDRIEILPAGGINAANVRDLIAATGCEQLHGSFRGRKPDRSASVRPWIHFGSIQDDGGGSFDATDFHAVGAMRTVFNHQTLN